MVRNLESHELNSHTAFMSPSQPHLRKHIDEDVNHYGPFALGYTDLLWRKARHLLR